MLEDPILDINYSIDLSHSQPVPTQYLPQLTCWVIYNLFSLLLGVFVDFITVVSHCGSLNNEIMGLNMGRNLWLLLKHINTSPSSAYDVNERGCATIS